MLTTLKDKIITKKAKVGVIGLGYVGLPLAVEFAKAGFKVVGIDNNREKVNKINRAKSYVLDVKAEELKPLISARKLRATGNYQILKNLDIIIICVPTPLRKTKEPDISYILSAARKISKYIARHQLVILESTTYPGTTEEVLLPLFEVGSLKVGRDFYLAFSPERVDPGNKVYTTRNIPKVVGGVSANCTRMAKLLYSQIIAEVIPVSSPRVAEMVKLLENTFRAVNIGLVNELALMSHKLGINVWEVIEAAKTKPFGFMPFYPGPGIGGECLPADPMYLSWKARLHGFEARFIELASQINSYMPHYVANRIAEALNRYKKSLNGSKVIVIGVTYKRDVTDIRESPALEIMRILKDKKTKVSYHDPYINQLNIDETLFKSIPLTQNILKDKDCVVIVTDHSCIDYRLIRDNSRVILDTRNVFKKVNKKIIKL